MTRTCLALSVLVTGSACGAPVGPPPTPAFGSAERSIIGGTVDTGDPSVIYILVHPPGDTTTGELCTGFVVSPHVIATAAHCVDPNSFNSRLAANFVVEVYTVPNVAAQNWQGGTLARSYAHDLAYDQIDFSGPLPFPHDVGVIVMGNPIGAPPLPINRAPVPQDLVGQSVRQVGYGITVHATGGDSGVKYQTTTALTTILSTNLFFASGQNVQCHGDSGGPSLAMLGGVETVIGLSSTGPSSSRGVADCSAGSYDSRLDVVAPFIDSYIKQYDPQSSPGAMPDAGSLPPPTLDAGGGPGASTTSGSPTLAPNAAPSPSAAGEGVVVTGAGCSLGLLAATGSDGDRCATQLVLALALLALARRSARSQ